MTTQNRQRQSVIGGLERLLNRGTLGQGPLSASVRIAGDDAISLITVESITQAEWPRVVPQVVPLAEPSNLDPDVAVHAAAYRWRGDVGALLLGRQPWCQALADLEEPMPCVFDEQARHLGTIQRLPSAPSGLAGPARSVLKGGGNGFLFDGRMLCLGMTWERAVCNCELLEKCAKAYVLARATGARVRPVPWLVRHIAGRRLLKDERRAAAAYDQGLEPTGFTAY